MGTYAVCLVVPGERELVQLADRLTRAGILYTPVFEPDAPYFGELMAIGCAPGDKEVLRRHLSSLPLLR